MSRRDPLRLAILLSGRGSNMSALVRACQDGSVAATPVVAISDRSAAPGLALARELGVAAVALPATAAFEVPLEAALSAARVELIALAGFMRILSREFVLRHLGRMLNIHPSLLPTYRGLHTHRRVLAAGEREHGASVHFVTPELDGGPVVLQSRVAVLPGDSEAALAARVLASEHVIYPRALAWFAQGRLTWQDDAAWLDGRPLSTPVVEDFRAPVPR
jgi:phosphoribosylglycinamide formyltransferase-1